MTDSSQPGKKKKITYKASTQGIERAENALKRLGFESKSNFAESQLISRSTVTKFFQRQPIQLDSFKRICTALKLNWAEITGIEKEGQSGSGGINSYSSLDNKQMVKEIREITVRDKQNKIIVVITLEGDMNSIDNWKIFESILQQYSGNSINIIDIKEGSIRLIVEGSQKDIKRLVSRINSGELTELNGFPVENIQILNEGLDDEESDELDDKWRLVQEIVNHAVRGRNLSDADLSDADLSRTKLSRAKLSRAKLSDADLSDADLRGADLSGADLSDADLRGAKLSGASLISANLISADLSDAKLSRAKLSGADLSGADLSGADLRGAKLSGADLRGADLSGANLSGADLRGAKLSGAKLSGAKLSGADLRGADLRGADLSGANLSGADLRGADLRGANLRGVNLSGADLRGAIMIGSILIGVFPIGTILMGAILIGFFLRGAFLRSADLRGANLNDAILSGANLSRANVKNARFGNNQGLSESIKRDLIQRGAIFEDYPGNRAEIPLPR
jgi:uncharacterized protein YjbI with pentapeptide repeats/DNA-binding Xre family transcriptional regulator